MPPNLAGSSRDTPGTHDRELARLAGVLGGAAGLGVLVLASAALAGEQWRKGRRERPGTRAGRPAARGR